MLLFLVPTASDADAVVGRRPPIGAPFTVPDFAQDRRRTPSFTLPAFGPTFSASAHGFDADPEGDPTAGSTATDTERRVSVPGPVDVATRELLTNALPLSCLRWLLLLLSVLLPADNAGSGLRRVSCDGGSTPVVCSRGSERSRGQRGAGMETDACKKQKGRKNTKPHTCAEAENALSGAA